MLFGVAVIVTGLTISALVAIVVDVAYQQSLRDGGPRMCRLWLSWSLSWPWWSGASIGSALG